jgi:HlyD family secretion protein
MKPTSPLSENQVPSLEQLLQTPPARRFKRGWWWLAAALASALVAGSLLLFSEEKATGPRFHTEAVGLGTLVVKVSATGNLQPTHQVDVGSELSGIVEQVFVEVNDQVKKGQELARLDRSKLKDAVAKSQANLAAAEAQVLQAEATAYEARAVLERYRQVAQLSGGKVPSQNEMDSAVATLKRAQANQAGAKAGVTQARANLQSDETNLEKAGIRSPINGVVLTREVDPGQTVAASFQAPVLFTLAEDLSKMELQVDVDEAEVARVKAGQKASFSVDAWPGRLFDAVVTRVGYGSQEKDGVVSYLTVLAVDNDDLSLRPGMTGTADITTLVREHVLLVPNAALRFTPPTPKTARPRSGGSILSMLMPRRPRQVPQAHPPNRGGPRVWMLQEGQPKPVEVKTGATDGRMTEILDGSLKAGIQIITETLSGVAP